MRKDTTFILTVAKKLKCIQHRGGNCKKCGIDLLEKPWLAHFHHRDPKEKSFGIMALIGESLSVLNIESELEKCDLLCANCHAETHFNIESFHKNYRAILCKVEEIDFSKNYFVTEGKKSLVKELANKGLSIKQISKETGLSSVTVAKLTPLDCKFGNDKIRKITDEQLLKELAAGNSLKMIALRYNMGYKTVWKRWRKINAFKIESGTPTRDEQGRNRRRRI